MIDYFLDIKDDIIQSSKLHPSRILNIYLFGSQVYGNSNSKSDWDVLIIANTPSPETEIKSNKFNIHILTIDRFQEGLNLHNIRNIECLLSPDWCKIQELYKFNFEIKLQRLKHSISHTNSNSWVKSKKKIEQGDYYIGIKSFYHALRIVMFGIQLSKCSKIYDWSCANYIWNDLISSDWSFEDLDKKYRDLNNKLLSEFRLLAVK